MRKRKAVLASLALFSLLALAVPAMSVERGFADADQALRDLASDHCAVAFGAHPDDFDFELLALLRRRYGVRTYAVCAVDPEAGAAALEEMIGCRPGGFAEAAAEIGAVTRTLSMPYPGFVRTEDHAFDAWDRHELLRRVVRTIREVRPALLLLGRRAGEEDGHSRALDGVVVEAFTVAADASALPGEGVPFAATKLLAPCPDADATARPDTGKVDLVRGFTYAEMGAAATRRCLEPDVRPVPEPPPGPRLRPYRALVSRVESGELLTGLDIPRPEWLREGEWGTRSELLAKIAALAAAPPAARPEEERLGRAAARMLGLDLSVVVEPSPLVAGEEALVRLVARNGGVGVIRVDGVELRAGSGVTAGPPPAPPAVLGAGEVITVAVPLSASGDAGPRTLSATIRFRGEEGEAVFALSATAELTVVPAVRAFFRSPGRLVRPAMRGSVVHVQVENLGVEEVSGPVRVEFTGTDRLAAKLLSDLTVGARSTIVVPVGLEALPEIAEGSFALTFWFGDVSATTPIRILDVEVPGDLSIAVVAAPGDPVGRALDDMGVRPARLLDEDLVTGDLSVWNAIVLPARAYYHRPVLRQANARLLEFVEDGGTLVVGACRPEEWQPEFAPMPFALREERVTRPNAPVTFPMPEHRLLHFPNEVRVEDFGGFRLDRGAFFPDLADPATYEQPIRTADPGGPLEPGILLRPHGKGVYAYVPLSLFRHLDDLNPASLKLLANLVSYRWRR